MSLIVWAEKFDVQKSLYKIISLRILGSFPQIATQQPILVGAMQKNMKSEVARPMN